MKQYLITTLKRNKREKRKKRRKKNEKKGSGVVSISVDRTGW